jgi:aspartate racemase
VVDGIKSEIKYNKKALLGVVGGMGMQATDYFCKKIISMQDVKVEQDYLDMLVYYKPAIPDRSEYLLGKSQQSPLPALLDAIHTLENNSVTCIAIPCVTSFYFYDELTKATSIPIPHVLKEAARFTKELGYNKIGLLATSGTINGGVFAGIFNEAHISLITPDDYDQEKLMELIYAVKKGEKVESDAVKKLSGKLLNKGAQAVVLGCTELSLLNDKSDYYIDIIEILANAALRECSQIRV